MNRVYNNGKPKDIGREDCGALHPPTSSADYSLAVYACHLDQ